MSRLRVQSVLRLAAGLVLAVGAVPVWAQAPQTDIRKVIGIDQKLGDKIPADVPFKDENGKVVTFGTYLGKRPLLVVPIFYTCRTGCPIITDGLIRTLAKASHPSGRLGQSAAPRILRLGQDLDVIMISIHPKETPALASAKKAEMLDQYEHPDAAPHWHLLTGDYQNIRKVTDAIGFRYTYDPDKDLIQHPTCTVIVSPNGTIAGYTIGNEIPTRLLDEDLKIAMRNEIAPKADQTFMFGCLMLDPVTGKTRLVVEGLVRLGGVITLVVLIGAILKMNLASRRSRINRGGQPTGV